MLQDSMFDRDTEVASNSAVSFNNEDEAEELALARLEAELRALEVEEEALAREEVEEEKVQAAEREADQAVASISAELRAHEELMRSCNLSQLALHEELALTKLRQAIDRGREFDEKPSEKLRQEAKVHLISVEKGIRGREGLQPKEVVIARVVVALQLATQLSQLRSDVREAELRQKQLHLEEQKKPRLAELLVELQAAALVCVEGLVPQDGGSRSQLLARMQALGEWAVPGSRMQLFGSTACDLHTHDSGIALHVLPCRAHCGPS